MKWFSDIENCFCRDFHDLCDQIWRKNIAQNFSKSCPNKCHSSFNMKWYFTKKPKKSPMFLGYFCKQICCQQLSKIAQSGHTNFISSLETFFAGNESCQNQKRDLRNISLFIISGQYCKQFTPFKILAPAGRWDTYPCCSGQPCSRANRLECFI